MKKVIFLIVLVLISCSAEKTKVYSETGKLMIELIDATVDECPDGGVVFVHGYDKNNNGTFEPDEIDERKVICDGADGKTSTPDDGSDGVDGKDGVNGSNGKDGVSGQDGVNGSNGKDGVDCWDLNENYICDLESEDLNDDGVCDVKDCRHAIGETGDLNGACYPNNTCNKGYECINGTCEHMNYNGSEGFECYDNDTCDSGLVCKAGICKEKLEDGLCGDNFYNFHDGFCWSERFIEMTFENALTECYKLGGSVPTIYELKSLIINCDDPDGCDHNLNGVYSPFGDHELMWSSTIDSEKTDYVYTIDFTTTKQRKHEIYGVQFFRCIE